MLKPNCRLKIYDTDDALTHTITDDVLNCAFTDICTTDVGSFTFTVPTINGLNNAYDNIGNNYLVQIELGYDGSYTHLFSGRITDFTTQTAKDQVVRVFEGKGLGATLERRFKRNKRWQNVAASDIVLELVLELSGEGELSGSTITNDATEETITVDTESYFDVLKKVSDYWYDGSTKVTKDFGIDKTNHLFWKSRPIRTVGVETITNIANYTLKAAILGSKNDITVYGAASAPYPLNRDAFTESATAVGWVANNGTVTGATGGIGVKEGTYRIHTEANSTISISYVLPKRIFLRDINRINFWYNHNAYGPKVYLYAPDSSNCFYANLTAADSTWAFFEGSLGENSEYDADERPTGIWYKVGDPNWWDIEEIAFISTTSVGVFTFDFDKLYFYPERWVANATDPTNIGVYEKRESEYRDDKLLTLEECTKRANTLLYQQKDRVLRLDFTVPGNINILLGDRLTIDLPRDNITAQPFDVVSVTQAYNKSPIGFQTTVHTLGTADTRRLPPLTPLESIRLSQKNTRDVIGQIYQSMMK
jgi:hypothetical protein